MSYALAAAFRERRSYAAEGAVRAVRPKSTGPRGKRRMRNSASKTDYHVIGALWGHAASPGREERQFVMRCLLGGFLIGWVTGVLGPRHVWPAVVDLLHGDTILDRANQHAQIAADALFVDHFIQAGGISP